MKLGIVTPSLGQSPYLRETLDSVASVAKVLNAKHIIVCPKEHLDKLKSISSDIMLLEQTPGTKGMYAAINQGLSHCGDCDWLTYLNDDDIFASSFIEMVRTQFQNADKRIITYGDVQIIDKDSKIIGKHPVCRHKGDVLVLWLSGIAANAQPGTIFSQKAFAELGGFDSSLRHCADFDFWVRAIQAGYAMEYYPKTVACFRVHGAQISGVRHEVEAEIQKVNKKNQVLIPNLLNVIKARLTFRINNSGKYIRRFARTGTMRFLDYYHYARS